MIISFKIYVSFFSKNSETAHSPCRVLFQSEVVRGSHTKESVSYIIAHRVMLHNFLKWLQDFIYYRSYNVFTVTWITQQIVRVTVTLSAVTYLQMDVGIQPRNNTKDFFKVIKTGGGKRDITASVGIPKISTGI